MSAGRHAGHIPFRLALTDPPTVWDLLSQAARRQPPPRDDAEFLRAWAGLSVFDSYKEARRLGKGIKWRHGEFIAVLVLPADAPYTYVGPGHRGHWMIYRANGSMLLEDDARHMLDNYVLRVVHGPSTEAFTL